MDARAFLEKVKKNDFIIKNKVELLKEKRYNVSIPQAINYERVNVQSSQRTDLLENGVCKYVDMEVWLQKEIVEAIAYKQEVIQTIEKLPCIEYDILFKRYIVGYDLNDLSSLYDRSYSWVTSTMGRAIKSLQKLLDERESNKKVAEW